MDDRDKIPEIYIFIDNSNLLHQGQSELPKLMGMQTDYINDLGIDYGRLVQCLLNDRKLGAPVTIVASIPSPLEKEWNKLSGEKFNVVKFRRNCENIEKGNDVALAVEATEAIFTKKPPGILVLVLGDGDYVHLARKAIEKSWNVELYFWPSEYIKKKRILEYILTNCFESAEISKQLTNIPGICIKIFEKEMCKKFAYDYTGNASPGEFSFEVTSIDIKDMGHNEIFEVAHQFDTFARWNLLQNETLRFVFGSSERLKNALSVISKIKPSWKAFEHVARSKRSGNSVSTSDSKSRSSHPKKQKLV